MPEKEFRYLLSRVLEGPREDMDVLEKRKISCCTGIRNPDRSGYSVVVKPALAEEILTTP